MTPASIYFTPVEREIVRRVATGARNREIAAELGVLEQTVKNYVTRIMAKVGVSNRTSLALWVMNGEEFRA